MTRGRRHSERQGGQGTQRTQQRATTATGGRHRRSRSSRRSRNVDSETLAANHQQREDGVFFKGGNKTQCHCVAISPDDKWIAVGEGVPRQEQAQKLLIFDARTAQIPVTTCSGHTDFIRRLDFSPDSSMIVSCSSDKTVKTWRRETGEHLRTFSGHTDHVLSVAFSPDASKIVGGSRDKTLKLWDTQTGDCDFTMVEHTGPVFDVAFSPNGEMIASASGDGSIKLWSASDGSCKHTFRHEIKSVQAVAFSPSGKKLASGGGGVNPILCIWNLQRMEKLTTIELGMEHCINHLVFAKDNTHFAVAAGDTPIRIINWRTATLSKEFHGHEQFGRGVAFNSFANKLFSCSPDGTVRKWDTEIKFDGFSATPQDVNNFANKHFNVSETNGDLKSGPLNRMTLIFVGEGGSGKTSTCRSLSGKTFIAEHLSTVGAETESSVTVDKMLLQNWNEQQDADGKALEHAMLSRVIDNTETPQKECAQTPESLFHEDSAFIDSGSPHLTLPSSSPSTPVSPTRKLPSFTNLTNPVPNADGSEECDEDATEAIDEEPNPSLAEVAATDIEKAIKSSVYSVLMLHNELRKKDDDYEKVLMRVFDLGGQSAFYAFHPLLLTRHAVYPCVFNMECLLDEERREKTLLFLKQWWAMLLIHAKGAPVLLVGTHGDEVSNESDHNKVSDILYEAFQNHPINEQIERNAISKLWFWPVDNTEGDQDAGVKSLQTAIIEAALRLPVMHKKVPLRWMALYEHLRRQTQPKDKNHSNVRRVTEVCSTAKDFGMAEDEVRECLAFLHELGFLMHYPSIPGMREMVVLNVQWAVDMMTKFIRKFTMQDLKNDETAKRSPHWEALIKCGHLHMELLRILWNDIDLDTQRAFLDLMIQFGLVMPLTSAEGSADVESMKLLCPPVLPFFLEGVHDSTDSLSNAAAMENGMQELENDLQNQPTTVAYLSFQFKRPEGKIRASVSVSELESSGFVPEGLFACAAGLLVSMSIEEVKADPQISRTKCMIAFEEGDVCLSLIPSIGCIRCELPASHPASYFRRVEAIFDLVVKELFPGLQMVALLPYSEKDMLLLDEVLLALQECYSLRVGLDMERIHAKTFRSLFSLWSPKLRKAHGYDVFISYRQRVANVFAAEFYEAMKQVHCDVFLDKICIPLGENFRTVCLDDIFRSRVACPLISAATIASMQDIGEDDDDRCDNVLLEWWGICIFLDLAERHETPADEKQLKDAVAQMKLKHLLPIFLTDDWENENMIKSQKRTNSFADIQKAADNLPKVVSYETMRELEKYCSKKFGEGFSLPARTIHAIVDQFLQYNTMTDWDTMAEGQSWQSRMKGLTTVVKGTVLKVKITEEDISLSSSDGSLAQIAPSSSLASNEAPTTISTATQTLNTTFQRSMGKMETWDFGQLMGWLKKMSMSFAIKSFADLDITGRKKMLGMHASSVIAERDKYLQLEESA